MNGLVVAAAALRKGGLKAGDRLVLTKPLGTGVIFAAAMRAPDHGQLRPWRFLTVEGAAREQMGTLLAEAARLQQFVEDDDEDHHHRHDDRCGDFVEGRVQHRRVEGADHGHHGDATDAENPRVRWRYDPATAGVSGQFADCGIHALHMASFICDDEVEKLSADFASTIASRQLEDDAMVNFRMSKGTVGRLWTSSVAIGRQHGFDIQVFGETGGFRWASEQPNQLIYTPVGGRTQIMEKGESGLYDDAKRLSRVAIAHPEGFPLAVANIYCDLADAIRGIPRDGLPTAADGTRSMAAVHTAVASARADGQWMDARPPMFR